MAGRLHEQPMDRPLAELLSQPPADGIHFYWLGQAGFVLEMARQRLVIDPYLSDSLAEKYRSSPRPHIRMMPPPVAPAACRSVDLVLATHGHTDHMDPGTLPQLLAANPRSTFIVPRAVRQQAMNRSGLLNDRVLPIDAGETVRLPSGIAITATRAAHESLERDADGNHRFLGYIFDIAEVRIWHSGDCIPFEGLIDEVSAHRPDVALLPVNGRRPELSENGVPGNFSLDEAIDIGRALGVRHVVAHHYGLFDFNTVDPDIIDEAASLERDIAIHRARIGIRYEWCWG